jgi:hypothetical protein
MTQRVQTRRFKDTGQVPPAGREPGELWVNLADLQLGTTDTIRNPQALLGVRRWSQAANYIIGDIVVYQSQLLQAVRNIAAGAFAPADWVRFVRLDEIVPEAPIDGQQYGRQSQNWTVIAPPAAGIPEAPLDNIAYGRRMGAWVEVIPVLDGKVDGGLF